MDREELVFFIKKAKEKNSKSLDLSNRDLEEIPPEIGELTQLEHLDLSYNYIKKVPHEIGKLIYLKTLLLLKNQIKALPPTIGHLKSLALLDISHNDFTTFPKEIGFLSNLKSLDASYSELKTLPIEFIELLSLKELYLEENPFEFPPQKVIKRGLYATMHYLTTEKKRLDAAKVMLQVFNMPETLQAPFQQYLGYFNDLVSNANEKEVRFDIKFIKHDDLGEKIDVKVGVENYLYDFMDFIKSKIEETKNSKDEKKFSIVDLQVAELRKQIAEFNNSLESKMNEIQTIQHKMNDFLKNLEK
ncbi:Leucine Rich repeats (2 copies) [Salinivirga cyanobacteriivorans]|uniref:Leucine Rich repeats (2 copies) n=1 Tax=Salinivirga cyanobacteriivorans TaxID=1307839 RepID=A0A0S2I0P1_9BACT|nr:leucine-rich repeat domain-containing protein [Salinivirga cyanobacteriivorans]ALO15857.1 Leucine Rich repeats (2 copies) [Salinivirga cyanobacteriivorans]